MRQNHKRDLDPEDDYARMAAEATNDSTPEKSLYNSSDRRKPIRNRPRPNRRLN